MPKQLSDPETTPVTAEKSLLRSLLQWSCVLTLLVAALYLFTPTGIFLDLKATDFLISNTTDRINKDDNTVTVTIDDKSLAQYGQWPWPRYRLAMLIEKIQQSGAKTISINILFPEPDRTSPPRWRENLHHDLGYSMDTSSVPKILLDHDAYLANTLNQSRSILGYELLFQSPLHTNNSCKPPHALINHQGINSPWLSLHEAKGVLCNNETLNTTISPSGFFNGTPDKDGILRRLPLLMSFNGKIYPSFALQTFLENRQNPPLSVTQGILGTRYISPGNIPIDRKGNFLINGYLKASDNHISAVEVLSGRLNPDLVKDKIVFIGITASGLAQKYRLATVSNISMVDIHKFTYQALTDKEHYTRGDFFWVVELLLTCIFTLLLVFSIAKLKTRWTCFALFVVISLLGLCSFYLSLQWGFIFSPLVPWICLAINFFVLTTLKFNFSQKRSASEAGNALQLLETSQDTLQSILNTIPDIVFRLDSSGRIIFISSAVARYKQLDTPLLGRSIFDLVVPEDQEKALYKLNERRTGTRATNDLELRLRFDMDSQSEESETRYFSVSAAGLYHEVQSNGVTFIGTQGIMKDITTRKHIEQQLLQAKKMEAMGNLAAGVAHDLNNILSGLVTYPDIILADLSNKDPLYNKISLIKKSGQRAAVIVQDLLTLARRNIHHFQVCDLNTIINDYLESTEHNQVLQHQENIQVQTDLLTPHASILCSSVHISKTVMNLINNSIEAMPGGGKIILSTFREKLSEARSCYEEVPSGDYVCLQIRDSGIGIPAEDISKSFEPFHTKKLVPNKGTGLGMTIIWATIKDHHGFIDIDSTENRGTTITLYLPATDKKPQREKEIQPLPQSIGGETILIVDDQEEQLIIGENMLKKLGYSVITTKNSSKAIDILKNRLVHLVLLDMIMPDQPDGLETYQEMLRHQPGLKTIIASGYSESDRVKKMQELGAGAYIQKPYSMENLAQTVRAELDRPNDSSQ